MSKYINMSEPEEVDMGKLCLENWKDKYEECMKENEKDFEKCMPLLSYSFWCSVKDIKNDK